MNSIQIRGEGVAASCCARLLQRAGFAFHRDAAARPRVPAIMLGEIAQTLLGDVFERQDLFAGASRIRRRIVSWGENPQPLEFSHSSVVMSEETLLERLDAALSEGAGSNARATASQDWTVYASRPLPAGSSIHDFGSRLARVSRVRFQANAARDACWTESLDAGWLFLLPGDHDNGWLLSAGNTVDQLLAHSELVADQISESRAASDEFPCYPRISDPLGDAGWLICGTAAVGFDPLCGDGAGYAAREAILAAAVLSAAARGGDPASLAAHYRMGVLATFRKHLVACRDFYRQGRRGPWWDQQLGELERGIAWCSARLQSASPIRYRLDGFELHPIAERVA